MVNLELRRRLNLTRPRRRRGQCYLQPSNQRALRLPLDRPGSWIWLNQRLERRTNWLPAQTATFWPAIGTLQPFRQI